MLPAAAASVLRPPRAAPSQPGAACSGPAASALLLAEPGGFQVQAVLQLLAGGLADGAVVVEAGGVGGLGGGVGAGPGPVRPGAPRPGPGAAPAGPGGAPPRPPPRAGPAPCAPCPG